MTYSGTPGFTWYPLHGGSAVDDSDTDDGGVTPTAARALSPADTIKNTARETTPLLGFKSRWSEAVRTRLVPHPSRAGLARKASTRAIVVDSGSRKSTYAQSLFNSLAILLGIGLLSEPLAFSYAGWVGGTALIIFYGWLTCYTAKILAKIIREDPTVRSYTQIAAKAFGPSGNVFCSILFCLELFTVSVVLVTIFADSFHELVPLYSSDQYKLIGCLILLPTVFLPLSFLSYASLLGVVSTIFIICVLLYDGVTKYEAPGSLWQPAETSLAPASSIKFALAFGLFMAGFSGHAVVPSLALDMEEPERFDDMINNAFVLATFFYGLIGAVGYTMMGDSVSAEISQDLLRMPGYNRPLNELCVWMLVIVPLTKYALATRPLNITLEMLLGLGQPDTVPVQGQRRWTTSLIVERVAVLATVICTSILVPDFSATMAFLGSCSAFVLCVIGPILAKVAVEGRCGAFDALLLAISVAMASSGTYAAFFVAAD
ncbi:transmembrane amino acid transporter protein-domain-containing protein [Auriculariales sp. MPI-PUGE-AT-0066]|nr:transmembrane amino acid transporter protein-domain-containing protein [Auriculariales sp. MPI-PUGE-AT-0066]